MSDDLGPGLGDSQQRILALLRRRPVGSVSLLAEELELARETVRDHLKSLAALSLVEPAGLRRIGPGRPEKLWRLAEGGERLFPRREDELLHELASYLLREGQSPLLERFFEDRADAKRKRLLPRVQDKTGLAREREVARILSEEGFLAEIETEGSRRRLRLCHCPLRALVDVSHLPCRAELDLVRELLDRELERESFMPDGDPACTYVLSERPGDPAGPGEPSNPGGPSR